MRSAARHENLYLKFPHIIISPSVYIYIYYIIHISAGLSSCVPLRQRYVRGLSEHGKELEILKKKYGFSRPTGTLGHRTLFFCPNYNLAVIHYIFIYILRRHRLLPLSTGSASTFVISHINI